MQSYNAYNPTSNRRLTFTSVGILTCFSLSQLTLSPFHRPNLCNKVKHWSTDKSSPCCLNWLSRQTSHVCCDGGRCDQKTWGLTFRALVMVYCSPSFEAFLQQHFSWLVSYWVLYRDMPDRYTPPNTQVDYSEQHLILTQVVCKSRVTVPKSLSV